VGLRGRARRARLFVGLCRHDGGLRPPGPLLRSVEGLQHDTIKPGYHRTGSIFRSGHIEDFDVTYSTRKEQISTASQEGLALSMKLAIIYRPIASELYELDSEIGMNYYDEVIEPEFKSAARGVLAHHAYGELLSKNSKIEDEIEDAVRERIRGKHIEISSITMEEINYAPRSPPPCARSSSASRKRPGRRCRSRTTH